MNNAYANFTSTVGNIKKFGSIYDKISKYYPLLKNELDDMLRAQIINVVSAMDCYIHEIVRIGIIKSFLGDRPQTSKWKSSPVSLENVQSIIAIEQLGLAAPQKEAEMVSALNSIFKPLLKTLSFQQSDKIKDALSYIWLEEHKMQAIANSINYNLVGNNLNEKVKYLEQKLSLIVTRRNQIAHEADWDSVDACKRLVQKSEVDDIVLFIEKFVEAIHNNVV